jgi:hypothetical protein
MLLKPRGIPYVEPDDAIIDYPGVSEDLAEWLNVEPARVTAAQFAALVPVDGMEVDLIADTANGVIWRMRYRAASLSAYKWEFMGGSYVSSEVATLQGTASAAYADLATVGPTITVPRAGEYEISFGAKCIGTTFAWRNHVAPKLGAAAAADADELVFGGPAAAVAGDASVTRAIRRTLAANDVVKLQYRQDGGNSLNFSNRWMQIRPVRIS